MGCHDGDEIMLFDIGPGLGRKSLLLFYGAAMQPIEVGAMSRLSFFELHPISGGR
jgi:hypothetical protein